MAQPQYQDIDILQPGGKEQGLERGRRRPGGFHIFKEAMRPFGGAAARGLDSAG